MEKENSKIPAPPLELADDMLDDVSGGMPDDGIYYTTPEEAAAQKGRFQPGDKVRILSGTGLPSNIGTVQMQGASGISCTNRRIVDHHLVSTEERGWIRVYYVSYAVLLENGSSRMYGEYELAPL